MIGCRNMKLHVNSATCACLQVHNEGSTAVARGVLHKTFTQKTVWESGIPQHHVAVGLVMLQ